MQIWNIKGTIEFTLFETILSEQDYELWKMREQIEKFVEKITGSSLELEQIQVKEEEI